MREARTKTEAIPNKPDQGRSRPKACKTLKKQKTRIKQKRVVADSPGFEPGTEAPEASVLSRLYYESS